MGCSTGVGPSQVQHATGCFWGYCSSSCAALRPWERLLEVAPCAMDEAPWIFVVHDLNPRAMSPKVKGFVQPQSWFVDLTLPWVEK
jgi:hypothetical protein